MLEFCVASKQDFPLICDLWHEGFPEDTAEDIALFWQHLGQNATCLLGKKDEHPVSMAFLIPAAIGGKEWWYVYAAVTRKTERGKGYFAALLDAAAVLALQNNAEGLFLRPAEESLFSYYARCGFSPAFYECTKECEAKVLHTDNEWKQIHTDYAVERNRLLIKLGVDFVKWSDSAADYARILAEQSGGGAFLAKDGLALCECRNGILLVRELLCSKQDEERLLTSLASEFACQRVIATLLNDENKNLPPVGMVRPLKEQIPLWNCHLGFTFE